MILLLMLLAAGCGHSATNNPGITDPVPEGDYLRATFNGRTWTSSDVNGFRKAMFNSINVAAFLQNGHIYEGIAFSMTGINSTGTYKFNPATCSAQMSVNDTSYATGLVEGKDYGTLKITTLTSTRVTGTFNLTVYPKADVTLPPMTVSNGSFNITLKE